MYLTIKVQSLDFDPQAAQLHVSGRITAGNAFVAQGSYHTLDLELQRSFTLEKADGWDSIALGIVKESINQDNHLDNHTKIWDTLSTQTAHQKGHI